MIEEIHGEQRKRDEALLKQVREARTEREHLLQQIDSLKEEVQLLVASLIILTFKPFDTILGSLILVELKKSYANHQ